MNISVYLARPSRVHQALVGAVVCGLVALPSVARSQSASDSAAYARAREMVANGDAAKGRRLADSVAATAPAGSSAFAEGLFWRAALADNVRDSERYYRQIIVDYPLSGRVSDALLRIGQLESARGDNAAALQHFQRLVLEHPTSSLRPEGSYWVAQMYFKANDPSRACSANADALANVKPTNVELKNRIDFQQQRCRGVALASAAPATKAAPVTVPVDRSPPAESVRQPAQKKAETKAETKAEVKAETKAETKTATKADTKADAKAESAAVRAHVRDSIATERALERVRAESISIAKAAETRALANAKARAAAEAHTAKAASSSPSRVDTGAQPSKVAAAHPGAVTREPTREEVARALASADMPLAKREAAKLEAKKATNAAPKSSSATSAKVRGIPPTGSGLFAVQIAAFRTRQPANQLAATMRRRGYDAYVDGGSAPYRVRMGHYRSQAAATAALAKLKAKHIDGFVAER